MTPLMIAAQKWRNHLVELLMDLGANPVLVNPNQEGAMHIACAVGNTIAVKMLATKGVLMEQPNINEETPLKICAIIGDSAFGCAEVLLNSRRVQPDFLGLTGRNLKRTALHEATLSGALQIMHILVSNGAKLDAQDHNVSELQVVSLVYLTQRD